MSNNIPKISKELYSAPLLFGFLIAMLLILPGCGQLLKKQAHPDEDRHSAESTPTAEGESIRAKATVEIITADGKSISGKAVILARTPDLFRIEFLDPFNQTAALLLSDGSGVYFYSKGKTEYHFAGDPDYPYPFTAAEFVTILLGESDIAMLEEKGNYRLQIDSELRIEVLEKIKEGTLLFRASMDDFRKSGARWYPHKIVMEDSTQKILINYNSIVTGARIDSGLFKSPKRPDRITPPS